MQATLWNRCARTGAWLALLSAVAGSAAGAEAAPGRPRRPRALNLFATAGLLIDANRVQCGLANTGEVCVAFTGSPVGGGGFWPKGTVDQYIFNSGLQIAAVVERGVPGFAWSGDTTGAWFFDPRDDQVNGDPLTNVYNSLDAADRDAWPNGATVRDPAIYSPVLLGQAQVSEQDSWVRYWEGSPALLGGRVHPTGVLVEQRTLAWNFPSGNEDIVYFIFTFYNVTASSPGAYNNSTIPPAVQAEIATVGALFQQLNEDKFGVAIPDAGYVLEDMYAAFAMDADVAQFSHNYSTAFLPFDIGSTYTGDFLPEVGWTFPPDVFGSPFFPAPGFVGVKYLRSPESSPGVQVGLTMFSNTTNGAPFPDAVGVNLLYRRLSGFFGAADVQCNPFTDPVQARARRLCFLSQVQADARFYQASGPFDLPPGEARTIVVAYIHAAPLGIVAPLVGTDVKPGIPFTGDSIAADTTKIRTIDRVAGWVTQNDANLDGVIAQTEVTTAPRSLLNKALIAQKVFDNKFLLPFAPTAPEFHLVPGDNQVTIVWQPSRSETDGDPFFAIASQAFDTLGNPNPLYDANFRQFDVEGYRVYRGRTAAELVLVAQFDYAGTTFRDFTGALQYGDLDGDGRLECAPELGLQDDCPVAFGTSPPLTTFAEAPVAGDFVQVKAGDRLEFASGVYNLKADTAVAGGGSGFPELNDTGVPFAMVDAGVRNSFTYVYAVTAFDVNSVTSGPSSLESPRVTASVTPRRAAPNEQQAVLVTGLFGDDDVALDPSTVWNIDAVTGRFTGSPPPTDALAGAFAPLVPQLLPALSLTARVDSLVPHSAADFCPVGNALGACYEIFATIDNDGVLTPVQLLVDWPVWSEFGEPAVMQQALGAVPIAADSVSAARFSLPDGATSFNATVNATMREYIRFSAFEGQAARRNLIGNGAGVSPGGSRWFSGTEESADHPAYGIRVGTLAGVDTVWAPIHHTDRDPGTAANQTYAVSAQMQCFGYALGGLAREADVRFTWGAGGTISAVRDVTHHVDVRFKPNPQATYGFVGDHNGNGWIDWRDFHYLETISQAADNNFLGFCNHVDPGPGARAALSPNPILLPVQLETEAAGTGTGFGLYVNGERYLFRLTGGTPPAAGTVWTLRTYAGLVSATSGAATFTPGGYRYSPTDRPPIIPGLRVVFRVTQPTIAVQETATTLDRVHTVPDPYYVTNALEQTLNAKVLKFVNLPPQALIRIYSASGVLVNVVVHDDPTLGGEATWSLRNRNNQFVASGVYFYHVETPEGNTKVGRFTIVNFAP